MIQNVEEGQPIPIETLPMTGVDGDVLTRDLNSAVPVGPPKASPLSARDQGQRSD